MRLSGFRRRPHRRAGVLILFAIIAGSGCNKGNSGIAAVVAQQLMVVDSASRSLIIYAKLPTFPEPPLAVISEDPPDEPTDVSSDMLGEALVLNANGNVRVYAQTPKHGYQLIRQYGGPNTRIDHPDAIVAQKAGSFYVADRGSNPSSPGWVEWFSGGAHNNIFPDKVLEGPHTGIRTPTGVAVDGSGRLFVADHDSKKILVFDSNASDDAMPVAELNTPFAPGRIAVDDLVNLYVTNPEDGSVTVFSSQGPESWDSGVNLKNQALKHPTGIAVDANGEIAVAINDGIVFFNDNARGAADPATVFHGPPPLSPSGICIR